MTVGSQSSVASSAPMPLPERPFVTRTVLPNGLTLLIQEDPAHPLVAFQAVVHTGSATEGPFLGTGISHLLEHMLFKGTARRAVGGVEREARSYGGTSQGFTTYDTTSYQLVVGREHWSKAADLLVDALFFSSLDSGEFEKERQVVLRELKLRRDDPSHQVWDMLFSKAYRLHPYRLPIIGEEPLVRGLTAEEIRTYHRLHYTPNQITVAVVGEIQAEEVARIFRELTAGIPPGRLMSPVLPQEPLPFAAQEVTEESEEAALGVAALGFPGFSIRDPDIFALDLLAWVLGGGRGSILEKSLRDAGLVHSVSAWNYTPMDRGLFGVTVRMDPEKRNAALQALWRQLEKVRSEPLPEEELAAAKKAFLRDYLSGRQSVAGQASDLAGYEVLTGDPLFAFRYLEQMDRLTSQDLQRVAQAVLKPERSTRVTLLPKGQGGALAPAGRRAERAKPRTEKIVLSNGLRLLLREDPRLPLVTFHAALLGGVRYETNETNGLSALTSRMLMRGTRSRSADQVSEELKRIGTEAAPYSGRNSLGITMEGVSSSALESAELLRQLLLEPAFSLKELEKERPLALAGLKAQEEDPFSWGGKRLMAVLFTRHPYRLDPAGSSAALESIQPEDLKRFYGQVLNPEKMVLCVTGDFRREKLEPVLRRNFGTFTASGLEKELFVPQEPPLERLRERREATPRKEGVLLIGFPGLRVDDSRLPALDLLETALSGGAGRLFSEVRERHGLAYTVGAYGMPGVDPGAFVLYAVTDPSHLEQVRQAILAELDRIRSSPIGAVELSEVREGFLGEQRMRRQSQRAWAAETAADELYGLGFDHAERYEAQIRTATSEQIRDLAHQMLDPQHCVVLIGEPASSSDVRPPSPLERAATGSKR